MGSVAIQARPLEVRGMAFTKEEVEAVIIIWMAHGVGVSPDLCHPQFARWKPVADGLVERGLCYRTHFDAMDELCQEELPPEERGYAFRDNMDEVAEEIVVLICGDGWPDLQSLAPWDHEAEAVALPPATLVGGEGI